MSDEGFGGALDLSTADTKGFEPIPAGRYMHELFDYSWDKTKGGANAKVPEGTPMLKLQFKCVEAPYENRRNFTQFVIPPADYDKDKADKMKGMLVRFLVAMGLDESKVKSKNFKLNDALDDLIGEPVNLVLSVDPVPEGFASAGEMKNNVKGFKAVGESVGATSGLL